MKTPILLILTMFFKLGFAQKDSLNRTVISKNRVNAFNKDSLRHSIVDKGSKYIFYAPGYGHVGSFNNFVGYAVSQALSFEYFISNKNSLSSGIRYNYSYLKHSVEVNGISMNLVYKRYIRIRRNINFSAFSGIALNNVILDDFNNDAFDYNRTGFTSSTGVGFHWMPIRKKKNKVSRFGLEINYSFLHFYTGDPSSYTNIGLKYRLN